MGGQSVPTLEDPRGRVPPDSEESRGSPSRTDGSSGPRCRNGRWERSRLCLTVGASGSWKQRVTGRVGSSWSSDLSTLEPSHVTTPLDLVDVVGEEWGHDGVPLNDMGETRVSGRTTQKYTVLPESSFRVRFVPFHYRPWTFPSLSDTQGVVCSGPSFRTTTDTEPPRPD